MKKKEKPWQLVDQHYIVTETTISGFFREHRWGSNFYESPVVFGSMEYPYAENAYQAAKSDDPVIREQFLDITPAMAKRKGRTIKLRKDWEEVKDNLMYIIVKDKFSRNPELRKKLLETGEKYLEELNWWGDDQWGVIWKGGKKVGKNKLGHIIMRVRSELRSSL